MRTTIDLDEELLRTAKAIAEARKQTVSSVINDFASRGLRSRAAGLPTRNGFPVLAGRPGALSVTSEHVAELLD